MTRIIVKGGVLDAEIAADPWPTPPAGTGFTETIFTSLTGHFSEPIPDAFVYASDYVSNPNNATSGLQNALDALWTGGRNGGTLVLDPNITYLLHDQIGLTGKRRFGIKGQGASIKGADILGTPPQLRLLNWATCADFLLQDFTVDGNRTQRGNVSSGGSYNMSLIQCTGATLANVFSNHAPLDGFEIRADTTVPTTLDTYSRNVLLYKSGAAQCNRNGLTVVNAYNVQIRGGCYNYDGATDAAAAGGTPPMTGIDLEPNNGSPYPGIDQVLIVGATFSANARGCLKADTTHSGSPPWPVPRNITVMGCRLQGGTADTVAAAARGSAISFGAENLLFWRNLLEKFGTAYDPLAAIVNFQNNGDNRNVLIAENCINDCSQADPAILVNSGSGTGLTIRDNRFFNIGGPTLTNKGGASAINNVMTATPTTPTPLPPWSVDF